MWCVIVLRGSHVFEHIFYLSRSQIYTRGYLAKVVREERIFFVVWKNIANTSTYIQIQFQTHDVYRYRQVNSKKTETWIYICKIFSCFAKLFYNVAECATGDMARLFPRKLMDDGWMKNRRFSTWPNTRTEYPSATTAAVTDTSFSPATTA